MNINLLPWREKQKIRSSDRINNYCTICFILIILTAIISRHLLTNKLNTVKNKNAVVTMQLVKNATNIAKRNKSLSLVSLLSNLPLIMQEDLYISKISTHENTIEIDIHTKQIDILERFLQKLKNQALIKKVIINSAAMHDMDTHIDEGDSLFLLTLYIDNND